MKLEKPKSPAMLSKSPKNTPKLSKKSPLKGIKIEESFNASIIQTNLESSTPLNVSSKISKNGKTPKSEKNKLKGLSPINFNSMNDSVIDTPSKGKKRKASDVDENNASLGLLMSKREKLDLNELIGSNTVNDKLNKTEVTHSPTASKINKKKNKKLNKTVGDISLNNDSSIDKTVKTKKKNLLNKTVGDISLNNDSSIDKTVKTKKKNLLNKTVGDISLNNDSSIDKTVKTKKKNLLIKTEADVSLNKVKIESTSGDDFKTESKASCENAMGLGKNKKNNLKNKKKKFSTSFNNKDCSKDMEDSLNDMNGSTTGNDQLIKTEVTKSPTASKMNKKKLNKTDGDVSLNNDSSINKTVKKTKKKGLLNKTEGNISLNKVNKSIGKDISVSSKDLNADFESSCKNATGDASTKKIKISKKKKKKLSTLLNNEKGSKNMEKSINDIDSSEKAEETNEKSGIKRKRSPVKINSQKQAKILKGKENVEKFDMLSTKISSGVEIGNPNSDKNEKVKTKKSGLKRKRNPGKLNSEKQANILEEGQNVTKFDKFTNMLSITNSSVVELGNQNIDKKDKVKTKKEIKMEKIKERKAKTVRTEEDEKRFLIYISNFPIKAKRKDFRRFFSNCGPIESIWIRGIVPTRPNGNKKEAYIKKEMHPMRTSCIAFVLFKDDESVEKALLMNGTLFKGHHLNIEKSNKTNRSVTNGIFLGNLPWEVEEEILYNLFSKFGTIVQAKVFRDKQLGSCKGCGLVTFKEDSAVKAALSLDGTSLMGKPMRVNVYTDKKSKKDSNKSENFKRIKMGPGVSKAALAQANRKKMNLGFMKKDGKNSNFEGEKTAEIGKLKKFKKTKVSAMDKKRFDVAHKLTGDSSAAKKIFKNKKKSTTTSFI